MILNLVLIFVAGVIVGLVTLRADTPVMRFASCCSIGVLVLLSLIFTLAGAEEKPELMIVALIGLSLGHAINLYNWRQK